MNDENIYGSAGNDISAPVLDDIEYAAPSSKKDGPQGVAAPVLDDMDYVAPAAKKGAPENVTAPVLEENNYSYTKPAASMTEDEKIIAGLTPEQKDMYDKLPPEKQKQIVEMRKAQLAQQKAAEQPPVTAPVLDDENSYTPPPKKEVPKAEAPVTAPVLDDEPAPAKYVPKYVDEDLERAKKEGAKRSVSSQLASNQKDEKESLRMMLELKAERQAEAAAKGFKTTIFIAIIGLIGAVLFYLLYSCDFFGLEYNDSDNKFFGMVQEYSLYIAVLAGLLGGSLISGIGGLKSLCSFFYLIFSGIQILGVFSIVPQIEGSGIKWLLCAGAIICSLAVLIAPSASENVGLYFKKPSKSFDH